MRNYIFLAIAVIVVYFIFFKKPKDETKTTTPASPSGGGTNTGPTPTNGPPYAVGETRLKLKAGKFAYDAIASTPTKLYENRTGAAQFLGGEVEVVGTYNGQRGYILKFQTDSLLPSSAPSYRRRAFYETDLII